MEGVYRDMQATFHQQKNRFDFWQAIKELEFITAFFTWFFMLLSRLAEPLMSLSAIYIILCAGIPTWRIQAAYNTGVACMIAAPEIILPGAFVLAGIASERGDKKAWLLHSVSWLFVLLTMFTLADLFIFHLEGPALDALMWARCAVGIGYSILLRVLTHGQAHNPAVPAGPAKPAQLDYQEIARHLKTMFPQPAPAPQIDYQEIARHIAPVMPAPQVDYREIARHFEATLRATIVREIREVKATMPQLEASSQETIEATFEGQGKPKARATKRNTGPLSGATQERQVEAGATDTGSADEKLEVAYQQLLAEGGRISGRALAPIARVNKNRAAQWLRATHPEATPEAINEGQGQQDSEPGPGDEDEATIEGQR